MNESGDPINNKSADNALPEGLELQGLQVKRKAADEAEKDFVEITPLGAGNEVGRSCHIIKYKGKTIMLDCGLHPGRFGMDALPFLDDVDSSEVDLVLVSHFHLDHAAAIPYFLERTEFKGRCFMTHPTKTIYKLILQDYLRVSTISVADSLYTEQDLQNSMDKIEGINYHQVVHHRGIKFWCYSAGHVLGAAMFMIEIAGIKILYTGDYSRREDRHLMAAETPDVKPDILIMESTYGTRTLDPVQERERRFTNTVSNIVRRGGKCLIPSFALGRAQELMLILEEHWQKHPQLHDIPIYYLSALAKKCIEVYRTFKHMMNNKIVTAKINPFDFKFIKNLKDIDHLEDSMPCVIIASPGMLQNGLSRRLFDSWCSDRRNGCIIAGYSVEGTLAKHLMSEPEEVTTLSGHRVPLKMEVKEIPFSAHADYSETSAFVETLTPPHIILVHGESNQMSSLQQSLQKQYADGKHGSIQILAPLNGQPIELEFPTQKIAKIIGSLAAGELADGKEISGLLLCKDFNYHVIDADDLTTMPNLSRTIVEQKLTVAFRQTYDCLTFFLQQMYDCKTTTDYRRVNDLLGPPIQIHDAVTIRVFGAKDNEKPKAASEGKQAADHLILEWKSDPVNDMIADSIIAYVMSIETNIGSAKAIGVSHNHYHGAQDDTSHTENSGQQNSRQQLLDIVEILQKQFGAANLSDRDSTIVVDCNKERAVIQVSDWGISCKNPTLRSRIGSVLARVVNLVMPISAATIKLLNSQQDGHS